MTKETDLRRAQHARAILDNPLWQEMTEGAEQALIAEWSTATTTEARETAWHGLQALRRMQDVLTRAFDTGKLWTLEAENARSRSR